MASSKDYLEFILEQLSELEDITYKAMMGEYIIYYRGKIVGGIYDDRFLVKPTKSAKNLMPQNGSKKFQISKTVAELKILILDHERNKYWTIIMRNLRALVPLILGILY